MMILIDCKKFIDFYAWVTPLNKSWCKVVGSGKELTKVKVRW